MFLFLICVYFFSKNKIHTSYDLQVRRSVDVHVEGTSEDAMLPVCKCKLWEKK